MKKRIINSASYSIVQPYGNVGVDSGQLLIIDPCYLEEFMKMYSYEDICNTEGSMKYKIGHDGIACKLGGFGGDGNFQVDSVTNQNLSNHEKYSPEYSKFIINLHE